MAKAIAGFFRTQVEGERAKTALYQAGFTQDEVSFMASDNRPHELPKVGPVLKDSGSESEAASDAFVGGMIGLAAGAIAVVLPGIGPLIAMGPIAAAIGGMTAGVAAGGVIGLLKDHGITEEKAEFYAEGIHRGGALITVHGVDDDREKTARKIMDGSGAIEVEQLADEWRKSGWSGPRTKMVPADHIY
ncbi:MAG TPA: hypothetical protein VKU19_24760 [Bryobacteraceae bacterium]|nr:hypothetical protein [Bryobacteraceae bacterium]